MKLAQKLGQSSSEDYIFENAPFTLDTETREDEIPYYRENV